MIALSPHRAALLIASVFLAAAGPAAAQLSPPIAIPLGGAPANRSAVPPDSGPAIYPRGMVSAADPRAADAGAQMLRRGGNAIDAAIATMLALNMVEPQSSGIGGGGFLLYGDAQGQVTALDGRETAPLKATPARFLNPDGQALPFRTAAIGGLSVGVPGNLALAAEAHRRFGRLPWADLFAPAILLAQNGFEVGPRLHNALERSRDSGAHDPAARSMFYGADGAALPVGTRVRNPALAETLTRVARDGAGAFYTGASASALASRVAAETPRDGAMTAADVTAYRAKERPPVCGSYRVYRICGMGPPSSGGMVVLTILKQLERFDLHALGPRAPAAWHLLGESQRLAYTDRERYLADADFVRVPLPGLLDPAYIASRSALMRIDASMPRVDAGLPRGVTLAPPVGIGTGEHGTSHFVAVDRAGGTVSYTSTIEDAFGSGILTGGFYLNNELTDFSFTPAKDGAAVANRVEGGKRPRSSMAPTLVYGPDGKLFLALGAAGGSTIPAQVAKVLIGVLDWNMTPDDALALPVLYAPGDTVYIEPGSALEAMIPALQKLGHAKVQPQAMSLKANLVGVAAGQLVGGADSRSEGAAVAQ